MSALNLSDILAEGYREVSRKPDQTRPIERPRMALDEVQALLAWCAAELDRHAATDRDISGSYDATVAMDHAYQQQTEAWQSVGDARVFMERAA